MISLKTTPFVNGLFHFMGTFIMFAVPFALKLFPAIGNITISALATGLLVWLENYLANN